MVYPEGYEKYLGIYQINLLASVAQVHLGELMDGSKVAIINQYKKRS